MRWQKGTGYGTIGGKAIPNYGAYVNMPESLCMGEGLE
jgi:hypothetical protein